MNKLTMPWWCFHQEQLASRLAAHEAERVKQGVTEQQAKDETQIIVGFLTGDVAKLLRGDV